MSTIMSPVGRLAELFAFRGGRRLPGGAGHRRAAPAAGRGARLRRRARRDALVAAALLHDTGHLRGADPLADEAELSGRELMAGTDNDHGERGAAWLARWFPPAVTEPVRLHVAAKRYLCAAEPGYLALLSPASVYTLSLQGGPMSRRRGGRLRGRGRTPRTRSPSAAGTTPPRTRRRTCPGSTATARCSPPCCEPRDRRTDGPQLPGPVVDVTEDPAADRAGLPSWSGRYVSSAGSPSNSVTSSRGSPCVSRRNS